MFKNYFTTAIRNLWRHKVFSLINVSGLAIGISASLVIYLIVVHEFSYDNFHKDGERIYRVNTNLKFPGLDINNSGVPTPLADAVRKEVPGVDASTAFITFSAPTVSIAENDSVKRNFRQQPNVIFADDQYFNIIQYEWIVGNAASLRSPFNVILTESRAKAYFKSDDVTSAIGKVLLYDDSIKTTVTGVVKDLAGVTDFTFKDFISLQTIPHAGLESRTSWGEWGSVSSSSQLLVKLAPGVKVAAVEQQLQKIRKKHTKPDESGTTWHTVQPLSAIHFDSKYDNFDQRQAHLPTLYGLLLVAAFLLVLGCINFINLTTAQSAQRAKEIGVRKTMGSSRSQLILQFLGETFLITVFATILSIALAPLILRIFADYVPPGLKFNLQDDQSVILFLAALVLAVTLLAGLYPAFILSRYKPVAVLKNQFQSSSRSTRKAVIRKGLTITQFAIAQAFIIATIVVGQQIRFAINKDLGYSTDAIIFFTAPRNEANPEKKQVLLNKLNTISGIEKISLAGTPPASGSTWTSTFTYAEGGKDLETSVELKFADGNYFELYGMKLLAGRNLLPSDTTKEYVINETYSRFLGFKNPQEALGKVVDNRPIVGVLADFHTKGLQVAIKPLAYRFSSNSHSTFHLSLPAVNTNSNLKKVLSDVEAAYRSIYPETEYEHQFFDESIARFYKTEQDMARFLGWATGLAIFISCLGLLGLVIYTTNLRVKEIGVRKVLGASVAQILTLLSKDFLALVVVAIMIAAPLAWYAMHNWLQNFAYRTTISWWIFASSGIGMILIALLTLSIQTIKAANGNPVKSLRSE